MARVRFAEPGQVRWLSDEDVRGIEAERAAHVAQANEKVAERKATSRMGVMMGQVREGRAAKKTGAFSIFQSKVNLATHNMCDFCEILSISLRFTSDFPGIQLGNLAVIVVPQIWQ